MTDLIVVPQTNQWHKLKTLVLDSVSSPITRRVYNLGLDEFFAWYSLEPRPGFTKATVSAWRVALEARGLGAVSINVRITAVRKLAVEAADNGLLAPELANGITRVKGVASKGVRLGNWLSVKQAQTLLNAPDITTTKGLRDRAILAVLLGCGLRRSEVAVLTTGHIQQRDGRWCIVDLLGKHGRVRTIPMPTGVKVAIDAWTAVAGPSEGSVFRCMNRGDQAQAAALSEKVVWQLLQGYAATAGVPGIAPHDATANPSSLFPTQPFDIAPFAALRAPRAAKVNLPVLTQISYSMTSGVPPVSPQCDSQMLPKNRRARCEEPKTGQGQLVCIGLTEFATGLLRQRQDELSRDNGIRFLIMYSFASESAIDLNALRSRLEAMDNSALVRFGKAAAYMCSPQANMGKEPREAFVVQLQRPGRNGGAARPRTPECAGSGFLGKTGTLMRNTWAARPAQRATRSLYSFAFRSRSASYFHRSTIVRKRSMEGSRR